MPESNFFRELLDCTHEVIIVYDENGRVIYLNQRASEELGLSPEASESLYAWNIEWGMDGLEVWRDRLKSLGDQRVIQCATEYLHAKSKDRFPVEVNMKLLHAQNKRYVIASSRNIQKRLFAERELAKNKELLEITGKLARVGGWDLDLLAGKLNWSIITKEIHEVPPEYEPDFQTAINFYKEGDSRNTMIAGMTAAIEHGHDLGDVEVELVTAKGRILWVRVVGDVERDETGRVIRAFGSIQDIDERKRIEIKLTESYRLLEQLTRNVPGAVYQLKMDAGGAVSYPFVSRGISRLFPDAKVSADAGFNSVLSQLVYSGDVNKVEAALKSSAETMEPLVVEFRHKDGLNVRWLESSARPEREADDSIVWHGYLQDISDRKKRRAELHRFVEVTAEQNKRLLNFTYIVSHNIRSHVANLKGILEILEVGDKTTEETFIPLMKQSVDNLDESIRNLNEIINIQSQVDIARKKVNLFEVIQKTRLNLKVAEREARAKVNIEVAEDFDLNTNPAYIDSILLNLLSNALKYRSNARVPEVTITASKAGHEVVIEVSDNGMGIDLAKYRELLFGMYKTFHHNKDAKGLGLFITKTQVEALGGKIDLESEVNKGTTIRVYLYE
jgi:two-component system aerobic respiration control sensor histidine kinase ArcB